jgi:hypothetical protein
MVPEGRTLYTSNLTHVKRVNDDQVIMSQSKSKAKERILSLNNIEMKEKEGKERSLWVWESGLIASEWLPVVMQENNKGILLLYTKL